MEEGGGGGRRGEEEWVDLLKRAQLFFALQGFDYSSLQSFENGEVKGHKNQ